MASINVDKGKTYQVTLNGRTVYGSFTARVVWITRLGDGLFEFIFDNGICLTNQADCTTMEVSEPPEDTK